MNIPETADSPSLATDRRLDAVCDRFEAAWKAVGSGGHRPALADFLDPPPADPTPLLHELIALDLHYRRRLGEDPSTEEYSLYPVAADPNWFAANAPTVGDTIAAIPGVKLQLPRPFGDYDLLSEVARGGMGVVFQARHRALDRIVALKVILAGRLASVGEINRFHTEAAAVARLDHPHIVPIYEIGEYDGQPYFTMRLIDGADLGRLLPRLAAVPRVAARLLAQVADGVGHAHGKAVLHRDLKPANVLLEGDPTGPVDRLVTFVTDFGLAKRQGSTDGPTGTGAVLGTPAYMAPEQAAGRSEQVGTATDVYGLGAILYALLTGRPPFPEPNLARLLAQVQNDEPVPPRRLNPATPSDLETICLKALSKDPARRYPAAADFAADLRRYLAGEPIRARPVGLGERAIKWVRRRPTAAGLTSLLVAVAIVGIGLVFAQWRTATTERDRADARAVAEEAANRRAQEALSRLRVSAHFQAVARADLELQANNVVAAEQTLDRCDPDLRGWEWRYLKARCRAPLWSLPAAGGQVTAVAWSPDGRHLAVASGRADPGGLNPRPGAGSRPPVIELIDLETGATVRRLEGFLEQVRDLHFAPDGRTVYACGGHWERSESGEVCAWEASTGRQIWRRAAKLANVWRLALAPDGRTLALATGQAVQLWDPVSGHRRKSISCKTNVNAVAFHRDGVRLAVALRDGIRVYDTGTGLAIHTFTNLPGNDQRAVAWHPTADRLAVGAYTGQAFLLDLPGGTIVTMVDRPADVSNNVGRVAFAPTGDRVAISSGDGPVYVYWPASRGRPDALVGHTREVNGLAYSPGGHLLASGSWDGTVKVWDRDSARRTTPEPGPAGRVFSMVATADGAYAVAAGYLPASRPTRAALTIWDLTTGRRIGSVAERVGGYLVVAIGPGDLLAHDDDRQITLRRRDGANWREWRTLPGHADRLTALAFHPNGDELASAGRDGGVKVWRWSPDGTMPSEPTLNLGGPAVVNVLAYRNGGRELWTGDASGKLCRWDRESGRLVATWEAHDGPVSTLTVHPNGSEVATGGADGSIALWDVSTGSRRHVLPAHVAQVAALAYAPDGSRLASCSDDGDVSLWDPASGLLALTFRQQVNVPSGATFTPDGDRLAVVGGASGGLRIWDARDPDRGRDARLRAWHAAEAPAAEAADRYSGAVFHLEHMVAADPTDGGLLTRLAWALTEVGRWTEAAEVAGRAARLNDPVRPIAPGWFRACWLRMAFAVPAERQRIAARVLDTFADSPDPMTCHFAGVICGYRPGAVADPARLVALAKRAAAAQPDKSWHYEVLAVAHLRAGDSREAVAAAEQVRRLEPRGRGVESFVEALAYARLGNAVRARMAFDRGETHFRDFRDAMARSGTRLFDYQSFRREAATALGLPLPDFTPELAPPATR
jgi:eukaryotic-like serine/threonine-protein kinase